MSDSSSPLFVAPAAEELAPLFPNYEVLNLVACGGMGAVYRARQASLDRIVAIKILPPELGSDREYAERFQTEARLMAKLSNPHIVTVFDFGLAGSYLYFVMEYVDGRSLHEVLEEDGPMKNEACARAMAEVCRGLDYAHGKGLVHLDIKPANIMINEEGEARVLDFGLAKISDPRKGSATESMGTPDYAAPERTLDGVKVDHRADIYSLGVMLYELLTGKIPRGNFTPASKVAGCDPGFDVIISRCTQAEPAKRYQRAGDIFGVLVKMRREAARLKRAGLPSVSAKATPSNAVMDYQKMLAHKGSRTMLGWVFGLLVAGALVGGLILTGVFEDENGGGRKGGRPKVATDERGEQRPGGDRKEERPGRAEYSGGVRHDSRDPDPWKVDEGPWVPEKVAGNGEDEPEDPGNEEKPFPPKGLEKEIAAVREAMDEGKDPAEMDLKHLRVFGGHVYYLVPNRFSWDEAEAFAGRHGAHLATLGSGEEEEFVRSTWFEGEAEERGSRPLWIGARWQEDGWVWVSGEEWDYEGWGENVEPPGDGGEALAAVIHENSWTERPPEVAYSALIEWDPPEKVAVVPPMGNPESPLLPAPPAAPLTPLEKLRKSFEDRMRAEVVEKRSSAIRELGTNYLKALDGLATRWATVPERAAQIAAEVARFNGERSAPEANDTWPELARVQGVLTTESRKIDESARQRRTALIRIYGDALLALQADFSSKGQWEEVELSKAERLRIEELKNEENIAAMVAEPKGLSEITVLAEGDGMARFVSMLPDGEQFLVTGWDGKMQIFGAEMGEHVMEWEAGHPVARSAFLNGSDRFVALDPDGGVEIWSLAQKAVIYRGEEAEGSPVRVSVRPDGRACAVGTVRFRPPKEGGAAGVRPWALMDSPVKGEFDPRMNGWTAFSPDGTYLAVSSGKGLVLLVYGEAEPVWTNEDCGGEALKFSANGKTILCGRIVVDALTGVTLNDLRESEAERFLDVAEARTAMVQAIALDPDGKHVAIGLVGGGIEVWDIESSERVVMEEAAHAKAVTGIEMTPDGKRLATSDSDGMVKLWEVVR